MEPLIWPNIQMGLNSIVDPFVIIGQPPRDFQPGDLITIIGQDALIRSYTVIYGGNRIGKN